MRGLVKILILIVLSTSILNFSDKKYYVVINEDGWELPSLDKFRRISEKTSCPEPTIKNCYCELYIPIQKIIIAVNTYFSTFANRKINALKIKSSEITVTGLAVYYYKEKPFCIEFQSERNGLIILVSFLDMDLDGKYESQLLSTDIFRYFFKFSPKVDAEDRFKGQLSIEEY